jgi:ribonuclease VapC
MDNSPVAFVLDSYALLSFLRGEPGGKRVLELLEQAESGEIILAMSLINLGEVIYLTSRRRGMVAAKKILNDLRSISIQFYEATEDRILAAAWIKAEYPISYADAFAASLTQEMQATLVTGDPEFKAMEKNLSVLWLE